MDWRRALTTSRKAARPGFLATLTVVAALAAPTRAQDRGFTLPDAIPADFFLVTAERHNPERAFLDAYWDEVWQAFLDTGFAENLLELGLSQLEPELREEITDVTDHFAGLFGEVDWAALGEGEFVFGERMPGPMRVADMGLGMQPDMVFLVRAEPGLAERTSAGMRAILDAALAELNRWAGVRMAVEELEVHGAHFATLNLLQMAPGDSSLPLSIGWREDVLIVTFGDGVREEVSGLLAGEGEIRAITSTPRYREAFNALPAPEDGFEYVDLVNLRLSLDEMMDGVFGMITSQMPAPGDRIDNAGRDPEAAALVNQGMTHYQAGEYDEALRLTLEAHETDPGDSIALYNVACLHALKGNPEEALDWLERAVRAGFHAPGQIAADSDLDSLRSEERYAAALDLATFSAGSEELQWIGAIQKLLDRGLDAFSVMDYSATVHETVGTSVFSRTVTALTADAEHNDIYPVITASRPVEQFDRYLPVEATAFSVTAGGGVEDMYMYVLESIEELGPLGAEALDQWDAVQSEIGFDLREDLLSWIDGETISVNFPHEGAEQWVVRIRITDEAKANDLLGFVVQVVPELMAEMIEENPMLGMVAVRTKSVEHAELEGFHQVNVGMMLSMVCGVQDGWLILGSGADAVALTERTGAGEHPRVHGNEELMAKALVPRGSASSVTFTDHSGTAEEIAAIVGSVAMFGGMGASQIEDEEVREVVGEVIAMVADLVPVIEMVNFYDSSASVTEFDGRVWRAHSVTHYVPPVAEEPAPEDGAGE